MDVTTWLISGVVLVVLAALVLLYFKYAKSAGSVSTFVGGLLEKLSGLLPDNPEKLDAHDILEVVGKLAEAMPKWAENPENTDWTCCKEEVLAFIEEQRSVVPHLNKLPKETLEKVAEAVFMLAKALPLK